MGRLEAARRMGEDEFHMRVCCAVVAYPVDIGRVGDGASAHHVQGDDQVFFVGDAHERFGQVVRDFGLPSGRDGCHRVIAFEAVCP